MEHMSIRAIERQNVLHVVDNLLTPENDNRRTLTDVITIMHNLT